MKVMYEASILGAGYVGKQKTGIFRVVENVAQNLIEHRDVDLRFYSDIDVKTVEDTLEYLSTKQTFNVSFSKNRLTDYRLQNRKKIRTYFSGEGFSKKESITERLFLKKAVITDQLLDHVVGSMMESKDLKQADIIHSPFFPLSKKVQKASAKKFITSHDIIPILFPKHAAPGMIEVIGNIIKTITPETWVLSVSQSTKNDLLNYARHINPDKVIVTELAASDYFYQNTDPGDLEKVRQQYGIPRQQYLLSLCTLEPRKNIGHLIRAFYNLIKQEHIEDLYLVLVGSKGWNFDSIFNEISSDTALRSKIILTGFVPDEDLAAIYSNALCFVYPTIYEGFGLPPLEAMQCGTPVVTSNTSSIPEVVGDAGIMLSPQDLDGLCNAIYKIYKSESYRNLLADKSLVRAKHFSWKRCTDETVNAYKRALQT